jgi:hypothetical protein
VYDSSYELLKQSTTALADDAPRDYNYKLLDHSYKWNVHDLFKIKKKSRASGLEGYYI